MFAQPANPSSLNGSNDTSMSAGGTSVYPPQPYGPGQQSITVSQPSATTVSQSPSSTTASTTATQVPQPSTSLKTSAPHNSNISTSNGVVANGIVAASAEEVSASTPRKRAASNSPEVGDGEAKEKKHRTDHAEEGVAAIAAAASSTSPTTSHSANATGSAINGIAATTSTSASANAASSSTAIETRQWGDEAAKLDVYVWDYLTRRGFNRTAKSLMNEASMSEAPDVPLKTPQGLLFEYWAIFWDVFAARSGRGSAEATAYYEMQENRQTQKLTEQNRRADAMEKLASAQPEPASATQTRFPPVLMGVQRDAVQAATTAAQLAGKAQQKTAINGQQTPNAQVQPLPSQQVSSVPQVLPQGVQQQTPMQQNVRPPTPGAASQHQDPMANWNNAPNALQQQTQMLLLAAQRQNIPIEELRNMNPAMRTALIQSVAASNAGQPGAPQPIRPGNAPGPFDATAMQQRLQQQQQQQQQQQAALQRQMQQQRNPSQPNIRPGLPTSQNGVGAPGTPIGMAAQPVAPQQQVQQGAGAPGMVAQGSQNMTQGQPNRPMPGNVIAGNTDGQAHPRLTPEQQQMLVSQHQSLQQTLRQELYQAQHAPTPPMAERSFQNAQQIQMRLAQLSALLKAQPALQQQQQPNVFAQQQTNQMQAAQQQQQQAQQQQQQQVGMVRPGMQAGVAGMQGLPPGFPAGLTPQQQQQFMARRAAQQAGRPLPPDANMMMNNAGAVQARPHQPMQQAQQVLHQPFAAGGNNGMSFVDGQHQHGTPQQLGTPQQQHGTPQQQHSGTPGPENQQRTPFAFANPFAAGAGGQRPGAGHGQQDEGTPQHASPFQHPQQPGAGAYGQRPGMVPQRMPSGMGPPGPQHMSSPSPRLGQNNLMGGDNSLNGSPAHIPSTPKTANAATPGQSQSANDAAAKKKKETVNRSRKNSKPGTSMTKTPVLGAASTPVAQAATPASSSIPTPGKDHGASMHRQANASDHTGNASGLNATSSSINPMLGGVSGGGSFDLSGQNQSSANEQQAAPSNTNLPSNANDGSNSAADDFSQMFNSGDMSQFLTDFDFPTGSFGSADGGGLGSFGDAWDGSNMGNLFGESS